MIEKICYVIKPHLKNLKDLKEYLQFMGCRPINYGDYHLSAELTEDILLILKLKFKDIEIVENYRIYLDELGNVTFDPNFKNI